MAFDPSISPLAEKTLSKREIYRGQVIRVREDKALHPSGHEVSREVAEHPGGVCVCPVLDDGRMIFVEQWRYPLGRTLLEFPAGKLDRDAQDNKEDPFLAIQRELKEETGYEATQWEELTYIFPAPGFCDEQIWLYKASGLKKLEGYAPEHLTPSDIEWLNLILLTPEEAWQKVRQREIVDAKTITLLALIR